MVAHALELDVTYHGRRIRSLEHLAGRLDDEGALAPGWARERVVEALMILTSIEAFEDLTRGRGHTPDGAADLLVGMTGAFVD